MYVILRRYPCLGSVGTPAPQHKATGRLDASSLLIFNKGPCKVDMQQTLLLLATSMTLLSLVFMAHMVLNDSFERRPRPVVLKNAVENPTFTESCYDYKNFTAENVCCRMNKYIASDVLQCVKRYNDNQILHSG